MTEFLCWTKKMESCHQWTTWLMTRTIIYEIGHPHLKWVQLYQLVAGKHRTKWVGIPTIVSRYPLTIELKLLYSHFSRTRENCKISYAHCLCWIKLIWFSISTPSSTHPVNSISKFKCEGTDCIFIFDAWCEGVIANLGTYSKSHSTIPHSSSLSKLLLNLHHHMNTQLIYAHFV